MSSMLRGTRSLSVIAILCLIASGAVTEPLAAVQDTIDIEAIRRATVTIEVTSAAGGSQGSGFLVSADGIVATAAHVIEGATGITVRLISGEEYQVAGLLVVDTVRDFALVRIAGFGLPTVSLGNSDSVSVGQPILAFGAPLGLAFTVSDGLLSSERLIDGNKLFQISAPTSPGSSGGPVTTSRGAVIGIVVSGIQSEGAENLNFALPINYVRGALAMTANQAPVPLAQWEWKGASDADALVAAVPRSIRIGPLRVHILNPGERTAIGVDYRVGNDLTRPRSLQWTSSNARVARVSSIAGAPEQATLTAIGGGSAIIIATIGDLSDSVIVNVRAAVPPPPRMSQPSRRGIVAEVQVLPPDLTLLVDSSRVVLAQVFDQDGTPLDAPIRWASSNVSVARVVPDPGAPTATVIGVSEGIAQIEARVGNVVSTVVVQVQRSRR